MAYKVTDKRAAPRPKLSAKKPATSKLEATRAAWVGAAGVVRDSYLEEVQKRVRSDGCVRMCCYTLGPDSSAPSEFTRIRRTRQTRITLNIEYSLPLAAFRMQLLRECAECGLKTSTDTLVSDDIYLDSDKDSLLCGHAFRLATQLAKKVMETADADPKALIDALSLPADTFLAKHLPSTPFIPALDLSTSLEYTYDECPQCGPDDWGMPCPHQLHRVANHDD